MPDKRPPRCPNHPSLKWKRSKDTRDVSESQSERIAVLSPGDLQGHRSFDGWILELAFKALGAYKVEGGDAVAGVTRIDGCLGVSSGP
jgi:hypothetical protein